ncbi:MAG: addiction module protein [Myxococcales bacterium]|nr:addiction module protein [Myxococcales bacterium]
MATRAQLVGALLELPANDRAEAARSLLESLEGASEDNPDDLETAWRDEVARRVREIESGSLEMEDGAAVMRTLRSRAQERLNRRRS